MGCMGVEDPSTHWPAHLAPPAVPELPEVETLAADLRPHLVGRTIVRCEVRFPTIVRHPDPDRLTAMMVAGVGNIYADESCFRAGVRPDRPANGLSRRAVGRLHAALGELLREAIANRGSSVDDYRDAWGEMGQEQHLLRVYGRGGQPC